MAAPVLHHHLAPLVLCSQGSRRLTFCLLQHMKIAQPSQRPQSQTLLADDLRRPSCLPPKNPGPRPSLPSSRPSRSPVPLLGQDPPRQASCSSRALCQRPGKAALSWVLASPREDLLCGWTCSRHQTMLQPSSCSSRVPAHQQVIPIGQQGVRALHRHRMVRATDWLCSSRWESHLALAAASSTVPAIRFLLSSPHHKESARSILISLTAEGFACLLFGLRMCKQQNSAPVLDNGKVRVSQC